MVLILDTINWLDFVVFVYKVSFVCAIIAAIHALIPDIKFDWSTRNSKHYRVPRVTVGTILLWVIAVLLPVWNTFLAIIFILTEAIPLVCKKLYKVLKYPVIPRLKN